MKYVIRLHFVTFRLHPHITSDYVTFFYYYYLKLYCILFGRFLSNCHLYIFPRSILTIVTQYLRKTMLPFHYYLPQHLHLV